MRFPQAWAAVAKQNSVLRVAILGVSASGLLALLVLLNFAFKDPLVIERGCYSSVVSATSQPEPSKEEVEGFIKESLSQRFDTDANVQGDLISLEEMGNRSAEQDEMKRRNVRQRVIVNAVSKKDDAYVVDTDRILAVGGLRSALPFPLDVRLQRTTRSFSNPYGLVLIKVSAQKPEGGNKDERK